MPKYIVKKGDVYLEFESEAEYQSYLYRQALDRKDEEEKKRKEEEKAAKKAQEAREEAERQRKIKLDEENRVRSLKEYCREHRLDFDTENRKYVKKKAVQNVFGGIVLALGVIAILFSIVTFTGWEFLDAFSLATWLIPGIAGIVLFFIGSAIMPSVPKGFYDQIKKK